MQCSEIFLHNRLNSRPVRGEALFLQLLNYIIEFWRTISQKKEPPFGSSLYALHSGIVRRFLGDGNVVGMAFYEAGGGDADEFSVYLELLDGSAAAVAHAAS